MDIGELCSLFVRVGGKPEDRSLSLPANDTGGRTAAKRNNCVGCLPSRWRRHGLGGHIAPGAVRGGSRSSPLSWNDGAFVPGQMSTAVAAKDSAAKRFDAWTRGYEPLAGIPDEFMDADGRCRPHWRRLALRSRCLRAERNAAAVLGRRPKNSKPRAFLPRRRREGRAGLADQQNAAARRRSRMASRSPRASFSGPSFWSAFSPTSMAKAA